MKRVIRITAAVIAALCLVLIGAGIYYYVTEPSLIVTSYTVEAKLDMPLRIVHLTDLHNAQFGENNCDLVQLVENQEPDLIFMTGDMLNRDNESLDVVCTLISDLSEIAPVYFGYGNHETDWEAAWGKDLPQPLTEAGAIVLNNEYIDTAVNGQSLRIGGYMGYYRQPGMFQVDEAQRTLELTFAADFENTDRLKLLLNHIPTAWVDWEYIDKFPVDIIFSGHYHGGMIRIPLLDRGVYAPYVGLFPKYTKGVFTGSKATCILSTGLGSEYNSLPRFNNPPEIVVVDLLPIS